MKKIHLFSLYFLIVFAIPLEIFAQKNAGIIPYFKNGNKIFVLIAGHQNKDRGWASFGGKHINNETNLQTAVREFNEETKKAFENQNLIKSIACSPKVEQEDFVSYFVKVDYISVFEINNITIEGDQYSERDAYVWIPLSELLRAISNRINGEYFLQTKYLPKNYKDNRLYEPFVQALQIAYNSKILSALP